jgi:nucleoside-diphosphate-sugar epimerase
MKALVTGGGGFLGRRIVELLRERGDEVTFLARGHYPEVEATGAHGIRVDLRDREAVRSAVGGMDVVFHVAAKTDMWGDLAEFWADNVDGTRNLIDALEAAGIPKLVYTSTPSVVGYHADVADGPRDLPYAKKHTSPYPHTKAVAERMVLDANSRHLATVAIRPHLVYGPRDSSLFPRVIERNRAGKLFIVGEGRNRVDFTYIDNAAWAHLDAERALTDHTAPCAGKAYFISDDRPILMWKFANQLFEGIGAPPVERRIPYGLARTVSGIMEWTWRTFRLSGEPRLTRFMVDALAREHWYDVEPAKEDLGYEVRIPQDEGLKRTIAWYQEQQLAEPGIPSA